MWLHAHLIWKKLSKKSKWNIVVSQEQLIRLKHYLCNSIFILIQFVGENTNIALLWTFKQFSQLVISAWNEVKTWHEKSVNHTIAVHAKRLNPCLLRKQPMVCFVMTPYEWWLPSVDVSAIKSLPLRVHDCLGSDLKNCTGAVWVDVT